MRTHRSTSQRGLSLVELMVGTAVGLGIVAGSAQVLAGQVAESRRLLVEARLMQDLRTAADLVTRDLRRAGHWGDAAAGVWAPAASGVRTNPYAALGLAPDTITFTYSRDASENQVVDGNEAFGFRLRAGTLEMQLGGQWQALTDAGTVTVTALSIVPSVQRLPLAAHCPHGCSGAGCPVQEQRSLAVQIAGRATADGGITRRLSTEVRLRNGSVTGACPA